MRRTPNLRAEPYRQMHPRLPVSVPGENWGYFEINHPGGTLRVIASDGTKPHEAGWEHVSVSLADRCPTWLEMQLVKEIFWSDEETVLQFHPRAAEYINCQPYVLHLWRQRGANHPLPPSFLIGPAGSPRERTR